MRLKAVLIFDGVFVSYDQSRPALSLVIPCYNESKNLLPLFARCAEVFKDGSVEVIFVDNGSTDDSSQIFSQSLYRFPFARLVHVPVNQGFGYGVLQGLKAGNGEYLGWTHADHQTDPADALRAMQLIRGCKDPKRAFAKGRRYGRPFGDVFFTVGMSLFETVVLRCPLWDINAQPNIFHRDFFESWHDAPHDFALELYGYYKAKRERLNVLRFPVHFGKRLHGVSTWNFSFANKLKFIKRTIDFTMRLRRAMNSNVGREGAHAC